VASEHHAEFTGDYTPSGNAALDQMLGGGLERGTNALLIGAAGVGKSSLTLTYTMAAARRGERVALFAFDEGRGTVAARSRALGLGLESAMEAGQVLFQQIDPAEMSPGEFAAIVRRRVEEDGVRLVAIDSLNGYLNAMPDGRFLILQMHELLTYLGAAGRGHVAGAGPARPGRSDRGAAGHQLPQRRGGDAALLRVRGHGAAGDIGGEGAQRLPRADHPRVAAGAARRGRGSAADRGQWRAGRRAHLHRQRRAVVARRIPCRRVARPSWYSRLPGAMRPSRWGSCNGPASWPSPARIT